MTDTEIDRIIEDAKKVNKEHHMKDMIGKKDSKSNKISDGGEAGTI